MTVETPSPGIKNKIWMLYWCLQWTAISPHQLPWLSCPTWLSYFTERRRPGDQIFFNGDPSTLPLMCVHCQQTVRCAPALVHLHEPSTDLAKAASALVFSKFSNDSTFLRTYSSNWLQKPCNEVNESCQSAEMCWDPRGASRETNEAAESVTARLGMSPDKPSLSV